MGQSDTQTFPNEVKAVHEYNVVDAALDLQIAGKRYHFIGAGGIGMSGLAKLFVKNDAIVTGSDETQTSVTDRLCEMGADIKIGHTPENLDPQTDAVVISAAIEQHNPELQLARTRGLKVYKYAHMLGLLAARYEAIAISGTHGKSTTSGWLAFLLKQADLDPNYIVGADITQLGGSSGTGDGPLFVAEACEYDRSFLNLRPKIGAILNIEQDHLDYYKDEEDIVEAFRQFALGTNDTGVLIANGADPNVAKVITACRAADPAIRCETFGLDKKCNYSALKVKFENGLPAFDVYHNGRLLGRTRISLPGRHNILNALAVVAIAANLGLEPGRILELLPDFTGVDRRLMFKGAFAQITVLDDYAHHPTEIRASLEAIRQRYRPNRLWCIFQPHQYSRTRFLLDDFAESFKFADVTIVPDIYFVRDSQAAKHEVNAQILVSRIRANGSEALFIDGFGPICDYLKTNVTGGDVVVTMGAGDIWKVSDDYVRWLGEDS